MLVEHIAREKLLVGLQVEVGGKDHKRIFSSFITNPNFK